MRKASICAVAVTLLLASQGTVSVQAATLAEGQRAGLSCEATAQLQDALKNMGGRYEWLAQVLGKLPCAGTPESEAPVLPEQPETKPEVMPEVKPETKPETSPEVQDTAYAYGVRITELVNEHRIAAGLQPVTYSAELSKPAQTRAYEIEKSFSHTRPDGRYFTTALRDAGISYGYAGENIAWGQKSPEEVVTAWMNSPGHRANILHRSFTKLGVGYWQNAKGVKYFTQLFTN